MNPHQIKRLFPNASKSVLSANAADYGDADATRTARNLTETGLERVLTPAALSDSGKHEIEAFIACKVPTRTAQQKGACVVQGKIRFFTKAVVKQAEQQWRTILGPSAPKKPLEGPLKLEITLHFPWRKQDTKLKAQFKVVPIPTRPDAENLCKSLLDQMTKLGFWKDDSQIAELTIRKYRSDTPGIHFTIKPSLPTPR